MSEARPLVFVLDDDVSVRESLELLIRHKGGQAKIFAFPSNTQSPLILGGSGDAL